VEAEPPAATVLRRVLRCAGVLAVAGFVALLVYGVLAQSPDRSIDDALVRQQAIDAPGFELDVLASGRPGRMGDLWARAAGDGRVDLAELRGAPVVINFWASWCDPCRQEARVLQNSWETGRQEGVLFVGLNMQDIREDARDFLSEFRQDYPNVRDSTNATARRWGVTGLPETFFLNRQGKVVGHVIGTTSPQQLAEGVRAAISGRAQGADEGGKQRPTR